MLSDFGKKRNSDFFGDNFVFKAAAVILLLVIIYFVIADYRMHKRKKELVFQLENYKNQIEEIKKSNETLKEEIANADNPDYLEKVAYEQLGQKRPGEKEFIFIMPEEKIEAAQEELSSWSRFKNWILSPFVWIKNRF